MNLWVKLRPAIASAIRYAQSKTQNQIEGQMAVSKRLRPIHRSRKGDA